MPDWFPEGNTPLSSDTPIRSLQKINGLMMTTGSAITSLSVTPTTGQTLSFNNSSANQLYYINPAGSLNDLTINLPNNATSVVGQMVFICCTQPVMTVVIQNAATILNNVSSFLGGDLVTFMKVANNVWCQTKPL